MSRMHDPAHPGEVLKEFLPAGVSIKEAAERMGISRSLLSRILHGRSAFNADVAIRVGLLTGTTPESWLANQMQWDLWQAEQRPRPPIHPLRPAA